MTRALGACVALVGLLSGSMAHAGEGGPKKYGSQIANLEAAADRLVREFANPLAIVRKFPNQRRLIDARVFYELGQFENAAMLLIDVMERPDFQGDVPPIVARPMVDVLVEGARRAEAEALLADFSRSGADAAEAEAETSARKTEDDSAERGPLWRRAIRWLKGEPPTGG